MKIKIIITLIVCMILYYFIDYKRYIIYNKDKTKAITIWPRMGNSCYIIDGVYYLPFVPENNFIKTVNYRNYLGILFNTQDHYKLKLSIYNDVLENKLSNNIKVLAKNDSLLLEYGILEKFNLNSGIRKRSDKSTLLEDKFDYFYIDLSRTFGIKIYDHQ